MTQVRRVAAAHAYPSPDLGGNELRPVELTVLVAPGAQQVAQVRHVADCHDNHRAVVLGGEGPAVDVDGVVGVFTGGQPGCIRFGDLSGVARSAFRRGAGALGNADRQFTAPVIPIDRLDAWGRICVLRADNGGEDPDLAGVGQGVQHRQGARIIAIGVHVGVEDDARRPGFRRGVIAEIHDNIIDECLVAPAGQLAIGRRND